MKIPYVIDNQHHRLVDVLNAILAVDQIVYKLYGLTEEEIAIVEGGNP